MQRTSREIMSRAPSGSLSFKYGESVFDKNMSVRSGGLIQHPNAIEHVRAAGST